MLTRSIRATAGAGAAGPAVVSSSGGPDSTAHGSVASVLYEIACSVENDSSVAIQRRYSWLLLGSERTSASEPLNGTAATAPLLMNGSSAEPVHCRVDGLNRA